ncbi:MAG: hypothetical protein A3D94_14780 [Alphaproteobacteria bacterium RIFCSPHIGHO2_12_FULL_66_14]|jgi:hypothetical protein|nr:MAG: hypothetical protein A3D94_14780 [Alphaproteobacteria bacterium RIFCSPHIGHO2_12_FULL_66_14]
MTPTVTTIAPLLDAAVGGRDCQRLRLDTIGGKMGTPLSFDRSMGFVDVAPHDPSPVPDTAFMELVL